MSVRERRIASAMCIASVATLLAACATGRDELDAHTRPARLPDTLVALAVTDARSDYSGEVVRMLDGQRYVCQQRQVKNKDWRYEWREVCSAAPRRLELNATLTEWRDETPYRDRYWPHTARAAR